MKYSADKYAKILLDDWRESILSEISRHERSVVADLCPELLPFLSVDYRGEMGESEQSIQSIEKRLGVKLPDDYVAFVKLVSRWPAPGLPSACPRNHFLPVDEIGLYRKLYASSYQIWMAEEAGLRWNEQIGVYGPSQLPERFCCRHLESCLAITTQYGSGVYVLNPKVTIANSWEAWWLDFHLPGAMRFPSFFALIEYEISRSISEINSILTG